MNIIRRIFAHIIANAIALYFVEMILRSDFIITGGVKGYVIAAIIFGILNSIVKPILKILSLPFMIISVGLFVFVINTFLVWFAAYALRILDFKGVAIIVQGGFFTYLAAGFLVAVLNMMITWLLKK